MSRADQGISADNLADVHLKPKRGRPRKYLKLNYDDNTLNAKKRGKKHLEAIPISPGSGVNGDQSDPAIQIQNVADVGQVVSGVIEAVFDAGYLLCVRVGGAGVTLRGVVFKPGHYAPVLAVNDVAPDVQMISRNTVPFATENKTNGNNPRSKNGEVPSRESSGAKLGFKCTPPHSTWDASKDKSIFAQISPSRSSRGSVVPVVLQPAKLTNGSSVATKSFTIQTAGIDLKGKEVLVGTSTAKESAPANPFQPQTSQQVLQGDASVENSSDDQSFVVVARDSDGKSMTLPRTPFESLVTEVIKRIQTPSLSTEMQTENDKSTGGKTSAKECKGNSEVVANIVDGPLMIEPLKAVQPHDDSSESNPKALDDESRTGKMTELLQENMMETPEPWAEVQNLGLVLKLDEPGESETVIEAGNQKQI
ncbi:uncharacterized protein LOC111476665 isoform X2 [Cucurbita maxima]|uniref:Uncharacterized protein LOC111476665 isoform X2 n=1 Tax=Cucurbita maxima TaxID=3661 RepID=A0A6J1IF72_CUCMA|nr:uncharacterized protein LOC111476665 isoform X2 [Cucurbita maxima]